jgi:hypothetical protein
MPPWRPGSTRPGPTKNVTPVSANSPLLKVGPKWQMSHLPLPMKVFSPRFAASG